MSTRSHVTRSTPWNNKYTATGSVRIPALANGCFALRTTTKLIPTDGIVSIYPDYDTLGILARDLELIHRLMSVWLPRPAHPISTRQPVKVMYLQDFALTDSLQQAQELNDFVSNLARYFDTEAQEVSIAEQWKLTGPDDETDLSVYLHNVNGS